MIHHKVVFVAACIRCGGTFFLLFYYKFTAENLLKELLKSVSIWQTYGKKVDYLKRPVHQDTVLLICEQLVSDLTYDRYQYIATASHYSNRLH